MYVTHIVPLKFSFNESVLTSSGRAGLCILDLTRQFYVGRCDACEERIRLLSAELRRLYIDEDTLLWRTGYGPRHTYGRYVKLSDIEQLLMRIEEIHKELQLHEARLVCLCCRICSFRDF